MTKHDMTAERIELGGGWHFAKGAGWEWFLRDQRGYTRHTQWKEEKARAFAAAIRPEPTFQARNAAWMDRVMHDDPTDLAERMHRFTEEGLELTRALGQSRDEAHQLVDYVHDQNHTGNPGQEMGGTMTTLACLAVAAGLDMMGCAETELARVNTPEMVAKIREKRSKRHGRGPLPGTYAPDFVPTIRQEPSEEERAKDEAYHERNLVVAALAKLFPAGTARTDIPGWLPEWHGCVYIDLPSGQVSWHYHDREAPLFAALPAYTKSWDGHDTDEKYRRLSALAKPGLSADAGGVAAKLVDELLSGSFETMEQVDEARAALLDYIAKREAEIERAQAGAREQRHRAQAAEAEAMAKDAEIERLTHERDEWMPARLTLDEWWQDHLDKNDRNSPEEYPEMALITFEELAEAVAACAPTPARQEPAGRVVCPECDGAGQWDEGPINKGGPAPVDPEYRQVVCPECEGTGKVDGVKDEVLF